MYLTSSIFNSLAKSNRSFYLPGRKYSNFNQKLMRNLRLSLFPRHPGSSSQRWSVRSPRESSRAESIVTESPQKTGFFLNVKNKRIQTLIVFLTCFMPALTASLFPIGMLSPDLGLPVIRPSISSYFDGKNPHLRR